MCDRGSASHEFDLSQPSTSVSPQRLRCPSTANIIACTRSGEQRHQQRRDTDDLRGSVACTFLLACATSAQHMCRRFFLNGKTLPINRSRGTDQPIMHIAAELVRRGEWLHVFPEVREASCRLRRLEDTSNLLYRMRCQ